MQRKLASVQQVAGLLPIEGADVIELAKIEGWQCVVKKGEFAVGDLGCFFEIDAIPPEHEIFRFLWTPKDTPLDAILPRPEKYRIRTMKLRGALSQGLLLPLTILDHIIGLEYRATHPLQAGDDLTELLGVTKYEPPAPTGMGKWRGAFPGMISKTDEMRVQSVPQVLDELRGLPYVITLKYDGTSATFLVDPFDKTFHACGRNFSIQEGNNLYWEVARRYNLPEVLLQHPRYAVQGEIIGPGIQKNPLGVRAKDLFCFNVFDFEQARYLPHDEAVDVMRMLGLQSVAVVEAGKAFHHTQDSLLALAEGKYPGTKNEREGIVIRAKDGRHSPTLGGRLSFKAISNRYLLKEE